MPEKEQVRSTKRSTKQSRVHQEQLSETGWDTRLEFPRFVDEAFQRYGRSRVNPNVPNVNTDWYNEVLQVAPMHNHSLTISGGNRNTRYSVGGSYFAQEGLLQDTRNKYERLNFRTKIDFDASEWLNVGGNVNISNATQYNADNGVWFRTYFAVPILPAIDELNTGATPNRIGNAQQLGYRGTQNPYINLLYNDDRNKIGKVLGNFYLDFDLIPDKLSFKTTYNYHFGVINARNVDFQYNDGENQVQSGIYKSNVTTHNQIWDNILTYEEDFGAHNIKFQGGFSYRSEVNDGLFAKGDSLDPAPTFEHQELWYLYYADFINEGTVGDRDNNEPYKFAKGEYGMSFIGRLAYNYAGRYLLYATFRRDGTNKFQQKWGNFPTFGAGWVLSEESFFNVNFVNFLKLRGSWGLLGNDGVVASVGAATLTPTTTAINDQLTPGSEVEFVYDLVDRWETTKETNVGISSDLFDGKLSLDADYYIRDTENAAVTVILPLVRDNVRRSTGEIRNSGFEMAISWSDKLTDNLSYTVGGNFATLKNEVISLGGPEYLNAGQAEFRQRSIVGQPFRAFFGYEVEGVFQSTDQISSSGLTNEFVTANNIVPGDFMFKDQNSDGVIDDLDRVVLGSYLPDLTYGLNVGVSFMKFDFSANIQGQSGHSILNRKRGEMIFTNDTNIDADLATNLWRGEGTSNIYPSAVGLRRGYNQAMSDYYVEDGSYFRIQNVRLSYQFLGGDLPEARITLTAERPLTVFDYNGFNPEVANGIDRQTYPIPAVYTIGLNIKL